MPGIVGLITKKPRDWAKQELDRMVKTFSTNLSTFRELGLTKLWECISVGLRRRIHSLKECQFATSGMMSCSSSPARIFLIRALPDG